MVNLVVDCLKSRASLDQLKDVWQALERSDTLCTPFSSWTWANAWWREFGLESSKLRIIIVRYGKEIVGICPLVRETSKQYRLLSVSTLSLVGSLPDIQSTHPGVIAKPRYRKLVEIAVIGHLPTLKGWDTLDLSGLDGRSSFVALARKRLSRRGGVSVTETVSALPQESVPRNWNDYKAMHGGQRARMLKQLNKAASALGAGRQSIELSLCSTRQDLASSLDAFYLLKQESGRQRKNEKDDAESQEKFFRAVVPEFFLADMLWQLTLRIDGRIAGVQHYLVWRGDILLFQGAYSPELDKSNGATFMMAYAIKRGMDQAMECVRVHTLPPPGGTDVFIGDSALASQLRFTPSRLLRVVEKTNKTLNK